MGIRLTQLSTGLKVEAELGPVQSQLVRGAIIKKTEKFGENSLMGGGNFFLQKSPNFNLGTSKIQGGVSIFQKCLN